MPPDWASAFRYDACKYCRCMIHCITQQWVWGISASPAWPQHSCPHRYSAPKIGDTSLIVDLKGLWRSTRLVRSNVRGRTSSSKRRNSESLKARGMPDMLAAPLAEAGAGAPLASRKLALRLSGSCPSKSPRSMASREPCPSKQVSFVRKNSAFDSCMAEHVPQACR